MIVPSEKSPTISDRKVKETPDDNPPPAYEPPAPEGFHPPSHLKALNYVTEINPYTPIKSQYVLDPDMTMPTSILPPLPRGGIRSNIHVYSNFGAVNVEVFIEPLTALDDETRCDKSKPVAIEADSSYGTAVLKIHDTRHLRPYKLQCCSHYGTASMYIPRSFTGIITGSTTYGAIKFSEQVTANMTMLAHINEERRCFIGDMSQLKEDEEWVGDMGHLGSEYGSLYVYYDDEVRSGGIMSSFSGSGGPFPHLMNKWFGKK